MVAMLDSVFKASPTFHFFILLASKTISRKYGHLDLGSEMGKKSRSGMQIRDEQPGSFLRELLKQFFGFKILKFFDADPGSLIRIRIRDGKNYGPG
jgi:hypothetical protein